MKILFKMSIIIVIFCLFTVTASADTADEYIDKYEQILPEGFEGLQSEIKDGFDIPGILSGIIDVFSGKIPDFIIFFLTLLGLILLLGCAELVPERMRNTSRTAVSVVSSLYIGVTVTGIFSELGCAVSEAGEFFSSSVIVSPPQKKILKNHQKK